MNKKRNYITPIKFHAKDKKFPIRIDFAFICYCPLPDIFKKYEVEISSIRFFVHTHQFHVMFCSHNSYNFVVVSEVYAGPVSVVYGGPVSEVYGGPVSLTTVEELFHCGFVCSFDDNLKIGNNIFVRKALVEMGTTPHYMDTKISDNNCITYPSGSDSLDLPHGSVWTTNAFYQETEDDVIYAKQKACNVVNMDTSHLYAACNKFNINCVYYATVSDILSDTWDNALHQAISEENSIVLNNKNDLISMLINRNTDEYQLCLSYKQIFKEFLNCQTICISHDFNHANEVMNNSLNALKYEVLTPYQREAVLLASLLHDADDKKFFPLNENNENARKILFDKHTNFVNLVIEMINLVSSSTNGDTLIEEEWKLIPRYSDRLEAIGAIGIQRCYEYTKTIGNPLCAKNTPLPQSYQDLYKIATKERYLSYSGKSASMIDHYYDKLLNLGNFPIKNKWLKDKAKSQTDIMAKFVLDFCRRTKINNNEDDDIFIKNYIKNLNYTKI